MGAQPESSTQEVLAGLVERVTYHNAENGFCVLRIKARGHRDVVTVVVMPRPLARVSGWLYEAFVVSYWFVDSKTRGAAERCRRQSKCASKGNGRSLGLACELYFAHP